MRRPTADLIAFLFAAECMVQSSGEHMDHVVYLDTQAKELENLLSGSKTLIIRGATGRKLPHGCGRSAGGLYSSSEDLYLWNQALYADQLLPKSETDQIFEPFVPPTDIPGFDEMYRWLLGESQSQPILAHGGGGVGSPFGTLIIRFPQNRLTVIALANQYMDQIPFWGLISDGLFGGSQ